MSLHARQVAIAAGASGELIEKVAAQMAAEKVARIDRAEEILKGCRRVNHERRKVHKGKPKFAPLPSPCGRGQGEGAGRLDVKVLVYSNLMKKLLPILTIIFMTACGNKPQPHTATQTSVPESTIEMETLEALPSFTPLPGPCATPAPDELNDFVNRSITIKDNRKTFIAHVASRFWLYLDDRTYPLHDLLNSIPQIIGYVSNGSIRGPQCYPIMFEAVKEGKGLLQVNDFQLSIVVDNNVPESSIPLP